MRAHRILVPSAQQGLLQEYTPRKEARLTDELLRDSGFTLNMLDGRTKKCKNRYVLDRIPEGIKMERDGTMRLYCHRLDIHPPHAFEMYPRHKFLRRGEEATRLGHLVRQNVDLQFGYATRAVSLPPGGYTWRRGDPDPLAHLPSRVTWTFNAARERVPPGVREKLRPDETQLHVPNDGTNECEYLIRWVEQLTGVQGFTIITS